MNDTASQQANRVTLNRVTSRRATDMLLAIMRGEVHPVTHYRRDVGFLIPLPATAEALQKMVEEVAEQSHLNVRVQIDPATP